MGRHKYSEGNQYSTHNFINKRPFKQRHGFEGKQHVYKTKYTKDRLKLIREKYTYADQKVLRLSTEDFRTGNTHAFSRIVVSDHNRSWYQCSK